MTGAVFSRAPLPSQKLRVAVQTTPTAGAATPGLRTFTRATWPSVTPIMPDVRVSGAGTAGVDCANSPTAAIVKTHILCVNVNMSSLLFYWIRDRRSTRRGAPGPVLWKHSGTKKVLATAEKSRSNELE